MNLHPHTSPCIAPWVLAAVLASASAFAHEGHPHAAAPAQEQQSWGIAADAKSATRTIELQMTDDMRFSPARIEVREGEIVKFTIRNRGKMLHELVLGTQPELDKHAALMAKFPGMEHHEAHMIHVNSGRTGTLVWRFNRPGEFRYACLIPGHYQAGMWGTVVVSPATVPVKKD
jgi:uncharacterized cupredoxin-like copper-binding protein